MKVFQLDGIVSDYNILCTENSQLRRPFPESGPSYLYLGIPKILGGNGFRWKSTTSVGDGVIVVARRWGELDES